MKSFSSAILAKLILDYRKDNKVSQEALATESGINRSVLSKIEQEEHIPSIAQIESLAHIVGFDVTELFITKKRKKTKT
ncbi:helix-turn-helix domain-containing protein [Streptococcus gallolyticus subsp. gallolyticus]|nr:helix-turn-helix domain-containing protein [Streptococcus gallolyticus subsp. gallolyticus]